MKPMQADSQITRTFLEPALSCQILNCCPLLSRVIEAARGSLAGLAKPFTYFLNWGLPTLGKRKGQMYAVPFPFCLMYVLPSMPSQN